MTTSPNPSRLRSALLWLAVFFSAFLVVLGVAAWNLLTPSRSVRAARDALAGDSSRTAIVQFDAGWVSTWWIRQGFSLARGLPAEARDAVATLRGASVGVYRLSGRKAGAGVGDESCSLAEADEALASLGYRRSVDVRSARGERVAVWLACPEDGGRVKACVAVRKRSELVVVSAELDGDALVSLAQTAAAKDSPAGRLCGL